MKGTAFYHSSVMSSCMIRILLFETGELYPCKIHMYYRKMIPIRVHHREGNLLYLVTVLLLSMKLSQLSIV